MTAVAAYRPWVDARDFGATGDGTTDDTTALTNGLAAARAAGKPLYIPSGTYKATATIAPSTTTSRLRVYGDGPGLTTILAATSGTPVFAGTGTLGSQVLITSGSAVGATTLTIASTSGLAAGDLLMVRDETQTILGNSGRTDAGYYTDIARVYSVDSVNTISLYERLDFAYTTSGYVKKITPIDGYAISDLTIRNPNPGTRTTTDRGINLSRARNVTISNVEFRDMDASCISFAALVVDFEINRCKFLDTRNDETSNNPYCVNLSDGCAHGLMIGCTGRYGRHLITISDSTAYIKIANCIGTEFSAAVFDTHPGARHITFENCTAHNTREYGFQIRGPDTHVINPTVSQATIGVRCVDGADRSLVSGGVFDGCDTGVEINCSNDCTVKGTIIRNPVTAGVRVAEDHAAWAGTTTALTLEDISITGSPTTGVDFGVWGNAYRVENVRVSSTATTKMAGRSTTTVTSGATVTLPRTADLFSVTGTATITSITADQSQTGRKVTLVFVSTAALTDGSNLKLSANLSATADDSITLVCDGTNWYETARSVN